MVSPTKSWRKVSQAPIKLTACLSGCGSQVEYRTNPRVYCLPCKLRVSREAARRSMEEQRRKRGIPHIKGRLIQCQICGADVVLNRKADTKYCKPCGLAKNAFDARARSVKRRATAEGRESLNAWHRNRRKADPSWRVAAHMRVLIHRALGKKKEGKSWRSFVPYSLEELMVHLERQFTRGMTWEKMGAEIHVDHIVPLSSFQIEGPDSPGFAAAWSLSNLRPMWANENIRKNASRTHLI